jgi:DNA-binding transcriptional LysR family regulator
MEPDLELVRAFVTVADELHFGRAALRLGRSQPQVSRQVLALEQALGVQLFERTPRRTQLTDVGASLLGDARAMLDAAAQLSRHAVSIRHTGGGRVAVAFLWSTLSGYLAPLVAAAAERHPEIELSVSQTTYRELPPALRRGEIDIAIGRPLYEQTGMIELLLCTEASMIAVATSHPFARQDSVATEQLHREPMVAFHRELVPAAYDALTARAAAAGLELKIVRHVRSASEALALVSAGIGVYTLPRSAAVPFPGVVYRPLAGRRSKIMLVHRPLPPGPVRKIVELATERFGDDTETASHDAANALERAFLTT